jgi:hypothetical protein
VENGGAENTISPNHGLKSPYGEAEYRIGILQLLLCFLQVIWYIKSQLQQQRG